MKIVRYAVGAAVVGAIWSARAIAYQAHGSSPDQGVIVTKAAPATPDPNAHPDHLDLEHWKHAEKTQQGSGDNFKYYDPDDEATITGAHAEYDDSKKILDCKGDLVLDDNKHHVTGNKAEVFYGSRKLAVITGNVVIVLKPQTDTAPAVAQTNTAPAVAPQSTAPTALTPEAPTHDVKGERGRGGTVTCDHVDDYYKKKFVILDGHLTFTQKITKSDGHMVTRTMTASHAEYDGKAEKMLLKGPVHAIDTDGQKFDSERDVLLGTHEGEETIETVDRVHIVLYPDKSDNEDQGPGTAKAAMAADNHGAPPETKKPGPKGQ